MESQGIDIPEPHSMDIFIASIGKKAGFRAQKLVYDLRKEGLSAESDLMERSVKAQMKYADKIGAKYTIVLGDDEIESNKVFLKNMQTGEQKEISQDTLIDRMKM